MRKLLLGLAICFSLVAQSSADSVFFDGVLDSSSPTFDAPGASGVGTALQHYSSVLFSVDMAGQYTIESASVNNAGTPSDALDTFLVLYASSFDPNSPGGQLAFDDDFTGTLSVLPGPYSGNGVTSTATGFSGAQPSSQILNVNLTAGTQYFLINTSFRSTDFVSTSASGQAVGTFYSGITGPGIITLAVPEPGSLTVLGLAGLGLVFRRRRG